MRARAIDASLHSNRKADGLERSQRTSASRTGEQSDAHPGSPEGVDIYAELERLRHVAATVRAGVWDFHIDTNSLLCSDRWYEILGLDPANPITSIDDFKQHIHPEDVARATSVDLAALSELVQERRDYEIEFRIVRPTGETRWVQSLACLIPGAAGVPQRAVGFIIDITGERLFENNVTPISVKDASKPTTDGAESRRQFDQETAALLRGSAAFDKASENLCALIDEIVANVADATSWTLRTGGGHYIGGHIITGRGSTLQLVGPNSYPRATHPKYIDLKTINRDWPIIEPGKRHAIYTEDIELRRVSRIFLHRTTELGWCWEINNTLHKPPDAAEAIVGVFLDSLRRAR